ncbi:hypothetical protein BDQ12DRAFT_683879 [Crucibulum laeve]|uniref:FAD/NAD(P)-binding domain-containing protein n=1 Tax=Crucibulum laeve TaxID=68775 RepID=A0A5C3M049_9AGAR|nr:hypothetical protein BDQ12DRAFT_683879 [Crucibulum laeve]
MGGGAAPTKHTKTVVVLGAAYGGVRASQTLVAGVPKGWRVILIDRNSHANHVYVMPRYAVLPGHEYKAFIPYTNVFLVDPSTIPHIHIQAEVLSIRPNSITLSKSFPELGIPSETLAFDYAIYALGSHLPAPLNLWGSSPKISDTVSKPSDADAKVFNYHGNKSEAVAWLQKKQELVKKSPTILVVGGGALGIQFATDIKAVYPEKKVTLLHSRRRLLPRFDEDMHNEIFKSMESAEIEVILGERLDLSTIEGGNAKVNSLGQKVVRTVQGREIAADLLLLCTGQTPNTGLLHDMDPAIVNDDTKLAHVLRTLQVSVLRPSSSDEKVESTLEKLSLLDKEATEKVTASEITATTTTTTQEPQTTPYPNIFVIGDAADAFGAIPAGHTAAAQGQLAARNIIRLIKRREKESSKSEDTSPPAEEDEPLEQYTPGLPAIKVSLRRTRFLDKVRIPSRTYRRNEGRREGRSLSRFDVAIVRDQGREG